MNEDYGTENLFRHFFLQDYCFDVHFLTVALAQAKQGAVHESTSPDRFLRKRTSIDTLDDSCVHTYLSRSHSEPGWHTVWSTNNETMMGQLDMWQIVPHIMEQRKSKNMEVSTASPGQGQEGQGHQCKGQGPGVQGQERSSQGQEGQQGQPRQGQEGQSLLYIDKSSRGSQPKAKHEDKK